jgi:hypothetical protein
MCTIAPPDSGLVSFQQEKLSSIRVILPGSGRVTMCFEESHAAPSLDLNDESAATISLAASQTSGSERNLVVAETSSACLQHKSDFSRVHLLSTSWNDNHNVPIESPGCVLQYLRLDHRSRISLLYLVRASQGA